MVSSTPSVLIALPKQAGTVCVKSIRAGDSNRGLHACGTVGLEGRSQPEESDGADGGTERNQKCGPYSG